MTILVVSLVIGFIVVLCAVTDHEDTPVDGEWIPAVIMFLAVIVACAIYP